MRPCIINDAMFTCTAYTVYIDDTVQMPILQFIEQLSFQEREAASEGCKASFCFIFTLYQSYKKSCSVGVKVWIDASLFFDSVGQIPNVPLKSHFFLMLLTPSLQEV